MDRKSMQVRTRSTSLCVALTTTLTWGICTGALAQTNNIEAPEIKASVFEYSAKVLCGVQKLHDPREAIVAPGTYFSSVNIHNPAIPDQAEAHRLCYKVANAGHWPKAGDIGPLETIKLRPDEVTQIDCPIMLKSLKTIEGYLVIYSERPLDVTAVVSAGEVPARASLPLRALSITPVSGRALRDGKLPCP